MDKTVMITGATSGIGRATALAIAHQGATVIVAGRNPELAEEVVSAIRRETGNPNVSHLLADLSAIEPTLALAEQVKARFPQLNVLVNNVGGILMQRTETADGFEYTFALNHLVGHFLLTRQLLPLLQASAPARIVNVTSMAHLFGRMHWDDLELRGHYSGWIAYGQAKLADVLSTYELARRLAGTGVTANVLHPGFVASNFGSTNNHTSGATRLWQRLSRPFAISTEQGAETSVYLATSPEVEGISGGYFVKKRPTRSAGASYRESDQRRLWDISETMLRGRVPEIEPAPAAVSR
jgi:NAD(P)-dependent dehydrogenase (short-subunit alcohol dehydrogenase family)